MNLFLQLGRAGDVINLLPVLEEENRNGKRPTVMVAEEFSNILEGVSYCDLLPYSGDYTLLAPAIGFAHNLEPKVRVSQIWGRDYDHPDKRMNFQRASWGRVGYAGRWEQIPLTFDRRNPAREGVLIDQVLHETQARPIVLVSLSGHSAPFPGAAALKAVLKQECPEFKFVDVSDVRAERIYDMLGLIDQAACLITSDSALLHLAQASSCPVITLVHPNPWLASARRANHLVRMRYDSVNVDCIKSALYSTQYDIGKLVHTYPTYKMSDDDMRRAMIAEWSWGNEYKMHPGWTSVPVDYNNELVRNSKNTIGDDRAVPFVKDIVDHGFKIASGVDDIVVLTNSDVGFVPNMTTPLRRLVAAKGAAYGYRMDFSDPIEFPLTRHETLRGKFTGGLDIFAFSRQWWEANRAEAPDMVMGSTRWDLVYRDLIKKRGGGELHGAIFHELHGSYWKVNPYTKGNIHNSAIADAWNFLNDGRVPFKYLK
jgi:hypothetical protein